MSVKPFKQVFTYRRNDISPWFFTDVVLGVANEYNTAFVIVENNGVGKIVADTLFNDYDYDNMLSSQVKKGEEQIKGYSMSKVGIHMNKRTKMIGCSALKSLIEQNAIKLNDWNTIKEFSSFVKSGNSFEAEKGKTDDLVMPFIHFGWLTGQSFFEDIANSKTLDILKSSNEQISDNTHLAFGFFSDGTV